MSAALRINPGAYVSRVICEVRKPNNAEAYVVALVRNRLGWLPELQTASIRPDGSLAHPNSRRGIRPDCLDEVIRGLIEARNALLDDGDQQ